MTSKYITVEKFHVFYLILIRLSFQLLFVAPQDGGEAKYCSWSVTSKPAMLALVKVLKAPVNMALNAT